MYLKPVKVCCIQLNIFHVVFGQWLQHAAGQDSQSLMLPLLEDDLERNIAHLSLLRMKQRGNRLSSAAGLKSVLQTGSTNRTGVSVLIREQLYTASKCHSLLYRVTNSI